MDVVLSLAIGLGLRVYLVRVTSPASLIPPALVGLWEGVLIHQLSFHPPLPVASSITDHYLALGLRLVIDFIIAGNWTRVALVGLWAAIGLVASESAFPSILNQIAITPNSNGNGSKSKGTRPRRARSSPSHVSSYVRVYQVPETPPALPIPPPRTSTPTHPAIKISTDGLNGQAISSPRFPPPSPPSFFLHANSEPSPFPDSAVSPIPIVTHIPARPRSSLSFYHEQVTGKGTEGDDNPPSPHLPTPDSTIRERTMDTRVDRLSTIDEITSRSEYVDHEDIGQKDVETDGLHALVSPDDPPLPVPNPTSQYIRMDSEDDPLDSTTPDTPTLPIPPITRSMSDPNDGGDELRTPGQSTYDISPDWDGDELKTPPGLRYPPPIRNGSPHVKSKPLPEDVPSNVVLKVDKALSPLLFDSQYIVHEPIVIPSTSLSSYAILQTPVPPTPLVPLLAPVPPIPSTSPEQCELEIDSTAIASDAESILSTRIPLKLLEHADDLRKQAIEEAKENDRLRAQLKLAEHERRPRDALFLRGDILNSEKRIQKLNEKAAKRFFAGKNNMRKPGTIDVHGLKPQEALQKTEDEFREVLKNGQATLRVIVGKGLHSKGGVPVVKNYIIGEMQKRRIPCKVDPLNSGILILFLPPSMDGTMLGAR